MRIEKDEFSQILRSQKKYKIIFVLILITWFINIGILGILRINIINLRMNEIMISDLTMDIQTHSYILHDSVDKYEETSNLSMKATYLSTINNSTSEMDLLMDFFSSVELEPQFTEMRDHVIDDWNLELKPTLDASIYFIDNNDPGNYSKLTHDIAHIILDIVSDLVELESYLDQNSIPALTSQNTFLFYFSLILSLVIIGIVTLLGIMSNRTTKFSATRLNSLNTKLTSIVNERDLLIKKISNSNQNLQQFAYTVSHDLKEPLRTVDGYLTLIDDRFSKDLNTKATQFLKKSRENVKNMGHFIEDLLEYSRIGTKKENFELFDSNILINNVINKIQVLIQESGMKIIRNSLPKIFVNPIQIEQLFQNLITNAIKFSNRKTSSIKIHAIKNENSWVFSVQDFGIGIDPKYFDDIFIVFKRLNNKTDYEGSGIGLSICKKIVEHHNGKIWVESTIGKGSTFFFTIPIKHEWNENGIPTSEVLQKLDLNDVEQKLKKENLL